MVFEMPDCLDEHTGVNSMIYKFWLDKILAFTAMVVSSGDLASMQAVEETIKTIAIEKIKNR